MAKYVRFTYNAGYVGTDTEAVYKFPDSYTDEDIEEVYEEWYEKQDSASGDFGEISEDEAKIIGIDEDYTEED